MTQTATKLLNPPLRIWDLTSNSTRWDIASASPSDQTLHQQFAGLAAINALVALSCFLLIVSILRIQKVRTNSFNCYLLAITLPDFISSFCCFLTCAMSSAAYTYYSEAMCGWQTWYLVWGFTSNCWINAVIAHQLYTMLRISHGRGRYNPPTRKRVAFQSGCVYLYAAVIAFLGVWHIPFLPYKSGAYQGFACFPKDYDTASTIFWWCAFVPAFLLIPLGYVLWCVFNIFRKGMLPPVGRRRNLAVYFFRLVFVFVAMWLPFIIIAFVWGPASPGVDNTWVFWAGASWSHLQGLVSVLVSLTKPDIKNAFLGTITFGWWDKRVARAAEEKERERSSKNSGDNVMRTSLSGFSSTMRNNSIVNNNVQNDAPEQQRPARFGGALARFAAGGPRSTKRFSIMTSFVESSSPERRELAKLAAASSDDADNNNDEQQNDTFEDNTVSTSNQALFLSKSIKSPPGVPLTTVVSADESDSQRQSIALSMQGSESEHGPSLPQSPPQLKDDVSVPLGTSDNNAPAASSNAKDLTQTESSDSEMFDGILEAKLSGGGSVMSQPQHKDAVSPPLGTSDDAPVSPDTNDLVQTKSSDSATFDKITEVKSSNSDKLDGILGGDILYARGSVAHEPMAGETEGKAETREDIFREDE